MAGRRRVCYLTGGMFRINWLLGAIRRRAPTPSRPTSGIIPNPSPSVTPTRATNKRKAAESLMTEADRDGKKVRRGEPVTLEEIRALPPSATRPFYPRILRRGTCSIKEPEPWQCQGCGYVNWPTSHLLFDLPAFKCKCGAEPGEGDTDFGFCFADLGVNDACPIGHVKKQRPGECIANALASCVEINHRIMMMVLEQPLSEKGPFINIDDLLSKYKKRWLEEGHDKMDTYNGYSLLTMISVFETDGVEEESSGLQETTNKLHKVPDWAWIDKNDFAAISSALADGYPLIFGFNLGPKIAYLEPGEVYMPPPTDSVGDDGKTKPEGHAAVLVGAQQEKRLKFFHFLNCWDEKFCRRSNNEGDGIRGGVGAIIAGGFTLPPIQILRFNERNAQVVQPK